MTRAKLAALKYEKRGNGGNQGGYQVDLTRAGLQCDFPELRECNATTDKGRDTHDRVKPTYRDHLGHEAFSARLLVRCYHGGGRLNRVWDQV
jgi:hypothetical protein